MGPVVILPAAVRAGVGVRVRVAVGIWVRVGLGLLGPQGVVQGPVEPDVRQRQGQALGALLQRMPGHPQAMEQVEKLRSGNP